MSKKTILAKMGDKVVCTSNAKKSHEANKKKKGYTKAELKKAAMKLLPWWMPK